MSRAVFEKSILKGEISAPPSKSMSHRLLLLSAISGGICKVNNLAWSQDVLAMIDCLKNLGCVVETGGDSATLDGRNFLKNVTSDLNCRESGNTLRFLIPICLTLDREITLHGTKRLMERPQEIYEKLCHDNGFIYEKSDCQITVKGTLKLGNYELSGAVSSQFISGMIFALLCLHGISTLTVIPPFESRSYVDLTLSAVKQFGGDVTFTDDCSIRIRGKSLHAENVTCEGDYSNAAFLDAFNFVGGDVKVKGLSESSAQGDKVYKKYFPLIKSGCPEIDISDCPDLGPVYMALAALNNGCRLNGTRRLAMKESDRGKAMRDELKKFGCKVNISENSIIVPKTELHCPTEPLFGHNDHRIVMSMALMASVLGGEIEGCEAVSKTFPNFFEVIKSLGCDVEIK